MFLRIFVACLAMTLSFGCVSGGLYHVVGPAASPPDDAGVPFFVKTAVCRHQTAYDEPHFTVTLILEQQFIPDPQKPGKWDETGRESVTLSLQGFRVAQAEGLLAPGDAEEVTSHFRQLRSGIGGRYPSPRAVCAATGLPCDSQDYALVANRSDPEVIVDYSRMFYVNTRRTSWSGSTNATVELAGDGTLSKVEASLEDTTLKTVLDALPVSAFASKVLGIETPAQTTAATADEQKLYAMAMMSNPGLKGLFPNLEAVVVPQKLTRARLEVVPTVIRHRFWLLTNANPGSYVDRAGPPSGLVCATPPTRLDLTASNVSYEQTLVDPDAAGAKAGKKEDDNSITVLGSIKLPKAPEAKKGDDKQ